MKHTQQQILDALKVIIDTCKEHGRCTECPLYTKHDPVTQCSLRADNPTNWKLNNADKVWRALL